MVDNELVLTIMIKNVNITILNKKDKNIFHICDKGLKCLPLK